MEADRHVGRVCVVLEELRKKAFFWPCPALVLARARRAKATPVEGRPVLGCLRGGVKGGRGRSLRSDPGSSPAWTRTYLLAVPGPDRDVSASFDRLER